MLAERFLGACKVKLIRVIKKMLTNIIFRDSQCPGFRTWYRRKFENFNGKPPIIVFSPHYFDDQGIQQFPPIISPSLDISGFRYILLFLADSTERRDSSKSNHEHTYVNSCRDSWLNI